MPPMLRDKIRRSLTSRMNLTLSKFGLENSVSGGKFDDLRQPVSPNTWYWSGSSPSSKPSRLIVHLSVSDNSVVASIPSQNTNGSFAYANTARRPVGGIVVRILPVLRVMGGPSYAYTNWEWLLWYCFWPKLAHGSSGQVFDGFKPAEGTFTYLGKKQPYIAAGLVTLHLPGDPARPPYVGPPLLYKQATYAIQQLIQVDLPPLETTPPPSTEGNERGAS